MNTLAQQLGESTPVSWLAKKFQRLGVNGLETAIALAALRGCRHYQPQRPLECHDPGRDLLSDEELTIFLISGSNPYEPTAIRCAAQLARSPHVDPRKLAHLARQTKSERVLSAICHAGVTHDRTGTAFWKAVLSFLPSMPIRPEPMLPHWSRYVSMPGFQRHGQALPQWLTPAP
jgi:hypothetical protein